MEVKIWRAMRILRLLIYTVLLSSSGINGSADIPSLTGPEHRLYLDLFQSYNQESRPVKNASHSVAVTFALGLNQLLDLDEKNQVLTTSVWIYEEWYDEMLTWSPSKYDGQMALMIPSSSIWLPDIFIFNTAGPNMNGFVNVNGSKVAIQYDGNVKWMVPLMVASACAVDVTYFPYDRQSCEIKFGSWIYDIDQVDIRIDSDRPDLEHYVMNSEYDLENVSLHRGVLDSSCCPGNGRHPMVGLKVNLRRKSLYYDYIVIAPTIMLCVMTLASFLLPCDRGEKMNIGLTVFLTLYVLQLRIADNVPDTNSTPILGVFMLVVMTFNCVSLIMATIVMNIKKLGDDSPCPDVPRWLFALCHHVLGRVICTPYIWAADTKCSLPTAYRSKSQNISDGNRVSEREATSHSALLGNKSGTASTTVSANVLSNPERSSADAKNATSTRVCQETPDRPEYHQQWHDHRGNIKYGDKEMRSDRNSRGIAEADREETLCKSKHLTVPSHYAPDDPNKSESHTEKNLGIRRRRQPTNLEQTSSDAAAAEENSFWPLYDRNETEANQEVSREEEVAAGFLMKRRWFYVAEVVDKFLFVVYLVLLTCSIFTVLFLIPVYFRAES